LLPFTSFAQTADIQPCRIVQPAIQTVGTNIFNDRQEQDLGDALAESVESGLRIAHPAADDHLTRIGERLLKTLPPTGIHYTFRVYDSGEINAFAIPGGRVYVSRKLIAAVKNEDELAGVLAHEIGHIASHQTAIELSRILLIRLGVTQVGDRGEIFATVHKLMSTPPKKNEAEESEEKDQLAADRVSIYAMVEAGYAPESMASFLNASLGNQGKTGNWFTDTFGMTWESSRRYRRVLKLIGEFPIGCKGRTPASSAAFQAWKRAIEEERVRLVAQGAEGDRQLKLDPPLRSSYWNIRFSPNGKYVLAQDEGSISVADTGAKKILFQIEAPRAGEAQFMPDSASVSFFDSNLRVESWAIASGKRLKVKELVVYGGCYQKQLSPDGKIFLCASLSIHDNYPRIGLRLIDVETGTDLYNNDSFHSPVGINRDDLLAIAVHVLGNSRIVNTAFSPDSHYLMAVAGENHLAFDLQKKTAIQLEGKLKGLEQTRMAFLAPDRLYAIGNSKGDHMYQTRTYSFPEGKVLKEGELGDVQFESTSDPRYLHVWPLKNYAAGIVDLEQGKIVAATKLPALDAWGTVSAAEDSMGGLQIRQINDPAKMDRIALPQGPLPNIEAGAITADGKYLTVSLNHRSAIWDMETGKRLRVLRPYTSAWIDASHTLFGQFPKFINFEPNEWKISLDTNQSAEIAKVDDTEWQFHDFELRFKPKSKSKDTTHNITFEVKKMVSQTVAWTRDFPHERPAVWPGEGDRLVLGWDLSSQTAKDEIKAHPDLEAEANALSNKKKGLLLEVVEAASGTSAGQIVLPEADLTHGWNDERRTRVSGNYVLVHGEHGNTVIYQFDTGKKTGEFFGGVLASDSKLGLVAAINREDELFLVDEATGKELQRFTLGSPVRMGRILAGQPNTLVVLTADQTIHKLPLMPRP
jgi:WD40 repeat protein